MCHSRKKTLVAIYKNRQKESSTKARALSFFFTWSSTARARPASREERVVVLFFLLHDMRRVPARKKEREREREREIKPFPKFFSLKLYF
jgi:hypothetical protein